MDDWFVADALDGIHHWADIDGFDEVGEAAAEASQSDSAWAGLCGATPDQNPLIGTVAGGIYVAVGWYGHDLMWAPAIGERFAEAVLGDGRERVLAVFNSRHFDGNEKFAVIEGMMLSDD